MSTRPSSRPISISPITSSTSTRSSPACSARRLDRGCERPVVKAPTIIVFDSGLGGLTVYREVVRALPHARYLYVADDAFFPYGGRDEGTLIARVLELIGGRVGPPRAPSVGASRPPPPTRAAAQ